VLAVSLQKRYQARLPPYWILRLQKNLVQSKRRTFGLALVGVGQDPWLLACHMRSWHHRKEPKIAGLIRVVVRPSIGYWRWMLIQFGHLGCSNGTSTNPEFVTVNRRYSLVGCHESEDTPSVDSWARYGDYKLE